MISRTTEAIFLFIGDLILLYTALFFTLFIRYGADLKWHLVSLHLLPFSLLFFCSLIVFFIAGLYERHTLFFQKRLPVLLVKTLVVNSLLAVLLFYFIPSFLITPRANLFIYLFVSFTLIFLWRWYGVNAGSKAERERGVLIGSGVEFQELLAEVNGNFRYNLAFAVSCDVGKETAAESEQKVRYDVSRNGVRIIVVDLRNGAVSPLFPFLYTTLFSRVRFVSFHHLYEEIFGRIPLSLLERQWFLESVSVSGKSAYDTLKRVMDMVCAFPLLFFPLVAFPLIALALRLEDKGPLFIRQTRVGKDGRPIEILKFRTMRFNDEGKWGAGGSKDNGNRITRVGKFLRQTRLDEFPALWNVLKGDLSLIGPRPEFPQAVEHYTREVPFYPVRHLIKPGLSGWAQLYGEHPHHGTDVAMTRNKLSYDLYYLKNRSFFLDVKIALKTIKVLLSRSGV